MPKQHINRCSKKASPALPPGSGHTLWTKYVRLPSYLQRFPAYRRRLMERLSPAKQLQTWSFLFPLSARSLIHLKAYGMALNTGKIFKLCVFRFLKGQKGVDAGACNCRFPDDSISDDTFTIR